MNCDGVRGLLSAYLDGELSPGELLRVEQHLRRCHCCADEVDSLRQTIALVASMDEVEVPATFHAQLHQRLVALGPPSAAVRRTTGAPSRLRRAQRWAMPAAAAVAVLAIGVSTLNAVKGTLPGLEVPSALVPETAFQSEPPEKEPLVAMGTPDPNQGKPEQMQQDPEKQVTSAPPQSGEGNNKVQEKEPTPAPLGNTDPSGKGIRTATDPAPTGIRPVLQPQYSLAVMLTATVNNPEQIGSAIRALYPSSFEQNGLISVTVPVSEYAEHKQRIAGYLGTSVVSMDEKIDLAGEIALAESSVEKSMAALTNFDKQASQTIDTTDVEQARAVLVQNVEKAEENLAFLRKQVSTVVITVQLQKTAR